MTGCVSLSLLPSCHHHFPFSYKLISLSDPPTKLSALPQNKRGIKWPKKICKANEEIEETRQVSNLNLIKQQVDAIKEKLQSVDDGELSISAYDTAWVALVKDINGSDAPLFQSSLEWIINNQLPDGSWGDDKFFCAYDRLSCTLACVVALKTWNICSAAREKGLSFIQQNLHKLKDEDAEHLLSGFEVTFTSLVELAHKIELDVLQDSTILQDLYAKREQKLKSIPLETLHNVPTTLLHSLEGIPDLDWEKLMKLQHLNGSFLCSTSSTAYALMQTKNLKCFQYIRDIVDKFNGGVPHTYPIDLFERLWVVDRLERLGFSRYFESEIKEYVEYVSRCWTSNGISWSRNTIEFDIDDTSMGFRILRSHGYNVNANAFQHFKRQGQFFCFVGQTSQGISEMLSLYRASQLLFPGEKVLEEAKHFAFELLKEKQDLGQVADRWLITKDLMGEVRYYLDIPWYASLPRIETRYYIDQYGGDDDVWIAKVLYRLYNVSNNLYLEFAKLDYNHCQKLHQVEWIDIQRWYQEFNLRDYGLHEDVLLKFYFIAMSSIFEPERADERLTWAKTEAMTEAVSLYFKSISIEETKAFIQDFNNSDRRGFGLNETGNELVDVILKNLTDMSLKVQQVHGQEVYGILKHEWNTWLLNLNAQEDMYLFSNNKAELLVHTINLCAGHIPSIALIHQPEYVHLANLTNEICNHLHRTENFKVGRKKCSQKMATNLSTESIEHEMQELHQHVLKANNEVDQVIKQMFFTVAKSYYYTAYCEPATIDLHIAKVLFEKVV